MEPRRARWLSLATLEMFVVTRGGTPAAALSSISIVTGANKGIGLAIAKKLADSPEHLCILTARDPGRGKAAVETLRKEGLGGGLQAARHRRSGFCRAIRIGSRNGVWTMRCSGEQCGDRIQSLGPHAIPDTPVSPQSLRSGRIISPPFSATSHKAVLSSRSTPRMARSDVSCSRRKKGRVVNVASGVGSLSILNTQRWRKAFTAPDLTKEQLSSMVSTFVEDVKAGRHESEGWPSTCYGMSKLGLIAYTTVLARLERESRYAVLANSCSPGYVATDMTSHKGTLTPEEGAWTPFVLTQTGVTGRLFRSGALSEW